MTSTSLIAQATSIFILCAATLCFAITWALFYDSSKYGVLRDEEQKQRIRKMGLKALTATALFYTLYFTTFNFLTSVN